MDDAKLERKLNDIIDALARIERTYDKINDRLDAVTAEFKVEVVGINADAAESRAAAIRETSSDVSEVKADIATIRTDVSSLQNDFDEVDDGFVKARLSIVHTNAILTDMIIELRELRETIEAAFDRVFKLYPDSVAGGRSLLDSAWNRSN